MKIFVCAKPKSKKTFVKKIDDTHFKIAIKEPPENQKANKAIIKALAKYLKIKSSEIIILRGKKSRNKTFSIKE